MRPRKNLIVYKTSVRSVYWRAEVIVHIFFKSDHRNVSQWVFIFESDVSVFNWIRLKTVSDGNVSLVAK